MKNLGIFLLLFFSYPINAQIITSVDSTGLYDPGGMAFDRNKNLYVTSALGNTIQKIDSNGILTTIAGTGSAGFSGDGGSATSAMLNQPAGIAIDTSGNILFADSQNQRIRKIEIGSGMISTIAGIGPGGFGTGGFSGDSGMASAAALNNPLGVCLDSMGNIYISDNNNARIRRINTSGIITTVWGNGVYGNSGDDGAAAAASIEPGWSILFDSYGNFYFTQSSSYHTVRKINTSGVISTILGDSTFYIYNGDNIPATNAHLDPQCIAFGSDGLLYISDGYNNRIRMIDNSGNIQTFAGDGVAGSIGDNGLADIAEVDDPSGIAFDQCGNLFFAQVNQPRIREVLFNPSCLPEKVPQVVANEVTIYPNPATEEINFDNITSQTSYELLNINGIIEQTGILKQGNNTIGIEALPPGVYILEMIDDEGNKTIKKIVKQ